MDKYIQIEMTPAAQGRGGFFHTEANFLLDIKQNFGLHSKGSTCHSLHQTVHSLHCY